MNLFSPSKVSFDIQLEKEAIAPGDMLTGQVVVTVGKEIELTALRLTIRGKESAWAKMSRNTKTAETVHFERVFTLFGYSKNSGRRGGATLDAGTYTYPFRAELPPSLPPSFFCDVGEGGSSEMIYTVKVAAVIPFGVDVTGKCPFTVLSCVPSGQLDGARRSPLALQPSLSVGESSGCCCSVKSTYVTTEVTLIPRIVVNASAAVLPPVSQATPDALVPPALPCAVALRIKVHNDTKKKLNIVRVMLMQYRQVSVLGNTASLARCIASNEFVPPAGPIKAGSVVTVETVLKLPTELRIAKSSSTDLPVPCVATGMIETSTVLEVNFPGLRLDGTLEQRDAVIFASSVDLSNKLPIIPSRYNSPCIFPETPLDL